MQKPVVYAIAATGCYCARPTSTGDKRRRRAGLQEGGLDAVGPAVSRFPLTDGRVSVTTPLGRPSLGRHQVQR